MVRRIEKSLRGACAAGSLLTACVSLGGCSEDRSFDGSGSSTADASALDGGFTGFSPSDGAASGGTGPHRPVSTNVTLTNVASVDAAVVDTAVTNSTAVDTSGQPATSSEHPGAVVDGGTASGTAAPGTTSGVQTQNTAGPTSITVDASVPNASDPLPVTDSGTTPADCVLNNNLLPCRLR